jgi:hypothetical protein
MDMNVKSRQATFGDCSDWTTHQRVPRVGVGSEVSRLREWSKEMNKGGRRVSTITSNRQGESHTTSVCVGGRGRGEEVSPCILFAWVSRSPPGNAVCFLYNLSFHFAPLNSTCCGRGVAKCAGVRVCKCESE